MGPLSRRALLYGSAGPVLAALVYVGFVREAEPDAGTLLSAVNLQLRLAASMPAVGKDGLPFAARHELLDAAAANLQRLRRQQPDSPIEAEFTGFLCNLRGDPRAAAGHYRRARGLAGCEAEQRDTLVFNEARMLDRAGDPKAALAVFAAEGPRLQPGYAVQAHIEQAALLHQVGRDAEALQHLDHAIAAAEPVAWLQAGLQLASLDRPAVAEQQLDRAAASIPIADYHHARLKLASGDVDSCLRLLQRAAKAVPAEVRRLLREDAVAWQGLAEDARFRAITAPDSATPGR